MNQTFKPGWWKIQLLCPFLGVSFRWVKWGCVSPSRNPGSSMFPQKEGSHLSHRTALPPFLSHSFHRACELAVACEAIPFPPYGGFSKWDSGPFWLMALNTKPKGIHLAPNFSTTVSATLDGFKQKTETRSPSSALSHPFLGWVLWMDETLHHLRNPGMTIPL